MRYLRVFALMIGAMAGVNICDTCGCSSGSSYFGMLPRFGKYFLTSKNYNTMYKVLLFSVCGLFVFSTMACKHEHDDHDDEDKVAPVLTITEPTSGASISGEVHIHGTVTDESSLHELSIKITRDSDNSEIFSAAPSVHDLSTYNFDERWTPSGLTTETDVTLTIIVADHGENNDTKTVKFKVKP